MSEEYSIIDIWIIMLKLYWIYEWRNTLKWVKEHLWVKEHFKNIWYAAFGYLLQYIKYNETHGDLFDIRHSFTLSLHLILSFWK